MSSKIEYLMDPVWFVRTREWFDVVPVLVAVGVVLLTVSIYQVRSHLLTRSVLIIRGTDIHRSRSPPTFLISKAYPRYPVQSLSSATS